MTFIGSEKMITLCADDYGQNAAISEGILKLIELKRLTATSCLTTFPSWNEYGRKLLSYENDIDIGLHFNLTEGNKDFSSLPSLLLRSHLLAISQKKIVNLLNIQLDNFINVIGRPPDFIDGHQHIHHLPVVRDALLAVYEQRLRSFSPYIRIAKAQDNFLKAMIIKFTGARVLQKLLIKKNIPHNKSFAGVYSFAQVNNYSTYFKKFLLQIKNHGLIMCHPGLQTNNNSDALANSRWQEFAYFSSEQFLKDCEENKIILSRFKKS